VPSSCLITRDGRLCFPHDPRRGRVLFADSLEPNTARDQSAKAKKRHGRGPPPTKEVTNPKTPPHLNPLFPRTPTPPPPPQGTDCCVRSPGSASPFLGARVDPLPVPFTAVSFGPGTGAVCGALRQFGNLLVNHLPLPAAWQKAWLPSGSFVALLVILNLL